jgi:hypothetical protein
MHSKLVGSIALGLLASLPLSAAMSIEMSRYSARLLDGTPPAIEVTREGEPVFRLPMISGLTTADKQEVLSNVKLGEVETAAGGGYRLTATADSSLWQSRRFEWSFYPDRIEFQHFATGSLPIERCFFFSNGVSERWANGTSPGVASNATIFAGRYFSPAPNHANEYYHTIAVPQSVGVLSETPESGQYLPEWMTGLFAPPPLFLSFSSGSLWTGVGLGEQPGRYLFNSLEYTGSRYAGASFFVAYHGYVNAAAGFRSPKIALHFGYDEFDTLRQYVDWMDASGYSTKRRYANAPWHFQPIFCGWAEQTVLGAETGKQAHDFATQRDYEKWISILEQRKIPFGTVVIDDKWQKRYGTFEVDEEKWPDFKGFVDRQHQKGRHVLLWVPAFHQEGLPNDLCVMSGAQCLAGDVSNPKYEAFLRRQVRHLVADLGVDGFKEDWLSGLSRKSGLPLHEPLFGIEFVRRFQFILADESHKAKPDALVETQTPNPLFRESSDVLRLNDIWYGSRDVPGMMRVRARISKIAGWPLVDCDNASSTTLGEWWSYMLAQPSIGIPALYFVTRTESTKEVVPETKWQELSLLWTEYVKGRNYESERSVSRDGRRQ